MDNLNAFVITFDCNNYLKIKNQHQNRKKLKKKITLPIDNNNGKCVGQNNSNITSGKCVVVCLGLNSLNESIKYNQGDKCGAPFIE